MSNQVCLLCLQIIGDTGAKSPQKIGTKTLLKLITPCHQNSTSAHDLPPDFKDDKTCEFCDACYSLFHKMEESKRQISLLEGVIVSTAGEVHATIFHTYSSHGRNNVEERTIEIRSMLLGLAGEHFVSDEDDVQVKVEEWEEVDVDPLGDAGDKFLSDDTNSYSDANIEKEEVDDYGETAFCCIPDPEPSLTKRKENNLKWTTKRERADSSPSPKPMTKRSKLQPDIQPLSPQASAPRFSPCTKIQTAPPIGAVESVVSSPKELNTFHPMSNSESEKEYDDTKTPRDSDDKDWAPNVADIVPISTSDAILPRYRKCTTCGNLFTNKNALADHTNTCYSISLAPLCTTTFHFLTLRDTHEKTAHEGVAPLSGYIYPGPPHQCRICKSKFRWPNELAAHMVMRHENGEKNLSCVKCDKKFCLEENLARHLRLHDLEESKPLVCDVCDDRFKDEQRLKKHMAIITHTKRYECTQCPQRCRRRTELERHLKTHSTEKTEKCPHCDYASCDKYNLQQHIARSHPVGPATHICHICGKAFHLPVDLKAHIDRHDAKVVVKCDTCVETFSSWSSLQTHLIKVHGKDPFVCDECGATFTTVNGFRTHKKVHAGEKRHKCKTCGACFVEAGKLKAHMRTHTGERPFPCPHCDKAFKTTSDMKKHVKVIHTPGYVAPTSHKCPHCEKKFPAPSSLGRHIRQVHTKERPFTCDQCGKAFAVKSTLTMHLKRTHGVVLKKNDTAPGPELDAFHEEEDHD